MSLPAVLAPLFAQVALTFAVLFWAAGLRTSELGSGAVRPDQVALREPRWSKRTMQVGNSLANQFELPLLFYVLTILEWVTRHAGLAFVVLAWLFVLSRVAHAYVHVTSNVVRVRGPLFGAGAAVLAVMWVIYIAEVFSGT
jgi:hypothetical protein